VTSRGAAPLSIRRARADEGERLREIMAESKASLGYDGAFVRVWAERADLSPEALRRVEIFVAEVDAQPVAWSAVRLRGETGVLDDMWVEPAWIGKGIGTKLFEHAVDEAPALGATSLEWQAEPRAVGFYEKLGGRYLRDSEPTWWGARLPVMGIDL
jgi:GNAT superfamily N-acetyltransferase